MSEDNNEPVSVDWLESIGLGGEYELGYRFSVQFYAHGVCEFACRNLDEYYGWNEELPIECKTRGSVRRFCECLGIELKNDEEHLPEVEYFTLPHVDIEARFWHLVRDLQQFVGGRLIRSDSPPVAEIGQESAGMKSDSDRLTAIEVTRILNKHTDGISP